MYTFQTESRVQFISQHLSADGGARTSCGAWNVRSECVVGEDETNSTVADSEMRRREMGCDRERDRTMLRQIASNNRSNEERTD